MNSRYTVFALLAVVFLVACSSAQSPEQESPVKPPRPIWERDFRERIGAVGVDVDCCSESAASVTGCLKWIKLGTGFYRFDGRGELTGSAMKGLMDESGFSENGKYLSKCRWAKRLWGRTVRIHTILDWNARLLWQTDDEILPWPVLRNDGSAVFFWGYVHDDRSCIWAARFYDRWGRLRNIHSFSKEPGWVMYGTSDSMFVLCNADGAGRWEISVFNTEGAIVWSKVLTGRRGLTPRNIDVSDDSKVVLYMRGHKCQEAEVLFYGEGGLLEDSLTLTGRARCGELGVYGGKAFLALSAYDFSGLRSGTHLMSYDLDQAEGAIVHRTDSYHTLRYLRGDPSAGLAAIYEYQLVPGQELLVKDGQVRVFGFDGGLRASIPVEPPSWPPAWFKVLPGGLLVADGSRLKMYEIE